MTGGLELGAQLGEVLDDAVVDQRDPAVADRGAGARCRRSARRGWPTGCARCRWSTAAADARRAPSRGWPACRPACRRPARSSCDQGDPRRVVAAVLQPPQALDDHALGLLSADVPDDSAHGRESSRHRAAARATARRHRPPLQQCSAWQARRADNRPRAVAVRRARPGRLGGARQANGEPAQRPRRSPALRGLGDAARPRRGRAGLPAAVAAAEPLRRVGRPAAPRAGGVPAPAAPAAHAVRDRARRVGGGRQVDDGARAAADARPLARAPERRAGHHRRLPAPQRRAGAARDPAPQGLPGVLRPARRCCASSSTSSPAATRSRRRSTPTWSTTSCPTTRSSSSGPTSSSSRASTCCSPPACATDGRSGLAVSDFFDFSVYVDAAHAGHPPLVRRAVPAAARDGVPRTRRPTSRKYASLTEDEAIDEAGRIWDAHQRAQPGSEHRPDPVPRHTSCCARTPTTRCATSGCASSDPAGVSPAGGRPAAAQPARRAAASPVRPGRASSRGSRAPCWAGAGPSGAATRRRRR